MIQKTFGFDSVITNPPYLQIQNLKELKKLLKTEKYKTYSENTDLYCLFYEKSIRILKEEGISTLITSNKWIRSKYGSLTRDYLKNDTNPTTIISFNQAQIFNDVAVEVNILSTQKSVNKNNLFSYVLNSSKDLLNLSEENKTYLPIEKYWNANSISDDELKSKIDSKSTLLKDLDISIRMGIKCGCNEVFIVSEEKRNEIAKTEHSKLQIKPILMGRNIRRYSFQHKGLYFIHLRKDIKKEDYLDIFNYLEGYKKLLILKNRKNESNWWQSQLICKSAEKKMVSPKIIWRNLNNQPSFCYDESGILLSSPANFISSDSINLRYLLGVLNSSITHLYLSWHSSVRDSGFVEYTKGFVEKTPIPNLCEEDKNKIINLVEKIILSKASNEDTTLIEKEIDFIIYNFYELTETEIGKIENEHQ